MNSDLTFISPTNYLLDSLLSTRLTTKVSLAQVCSVKCESIMRYNYYLANEYHKENT